MNVEPCSFCTRSFNPASLSRHEMICGHSSSKKHRVFNSQKQRIVGTGMGSGLPHNSPKVRIGGSTNWRQQHEDFINSIRSARTATNAIAKGLPLPPPPPPSLNPDYVECPYCLRRFNDTAAPRHISFCKTNANRRVLARPNPQPSTSHPLPRSSNMPQIQMAVKQVTNTGMGSQYSSQSYPQSSSRPHPQNNPEPSFQSTSQSYPQPTSQAYSRAPSNVYPQQQTVKVPIPSYPVRGTMTSTARAAVNTNKMPMYVGGNDMPSNSAMMQASMRGIVKAPTGPELPYRRQ